MAAPGTSKSSRSVKAKATRSNSKPPNRKKSPEEVGLEYGYRSGLEELNAEWLKKNGFPVLFEVEKIAFIQPELKRTYCPDFKLAEGLYVETKGRFLQPDRAKHLWVKTQRPDLDIRFVFSNPDAPINKGSKTTYRMWCERHGFRWAKRLIPLEWIEEAKVLAGLE